MERLESHCCFGGTVEIWQHHSASLSCPMKFSVFLPAAIKNGMVPAITFLSGLTCTCDNFTTKAGAYRQAAALGIAIIAPDTSPRGDDVPDDVDAYDFGKGAGFYINATQDPWAKHYRMEDYIARELYDLLPVRFPIDKERQSIMGHSMGGHGALTLFFKYPHHYRSVSAFSPIVAPSQVPWGKKAFMGYLGGDKTTWAKHDACALVAGSQQKDVTILIDQGCADNFLSSQLRPDLFDTACKNAGQSLNLRMHEGYDHSYYFIQSFIEDHISHHSHYLKP